MSTTYRPYKNGITAVESGTWEFKAVTIKEVNDADGRTGILSHYIDRLILDGEGDSMLLARKAALDKARAIYNKHLSRSYWEFTSIRQIA